MEVLLKRLSCLAAVLALVLGSALVAVAPAHAAYTDCPAGNVCLWGGLNWAGSPMYVHGAPPGTCINLPSAVNNRASSFYNRLSGSERAVQFYDGSGCAGTLLRRQANGSGGPHFSQARDNFYLDRFLDHRDRVTSIFYNSCVGAGCSIIASGTDVGGLSRQRGHYLVQSDCGVGYVLCLWSGGEPFTGTIYRIPPQPLGYCYNLPDWYNDEANHFYNRYQTRHVQFYQDRDCKGHLLHKNVPGCPGGPFPGQSSGEFWWDRSYTGDCHGASYDTNRLTSVFFNTG